MGKLNRVAWRWGVASLLMMTILLANATLPRNVIAQDETALVGAVTFVKDTEGDLSGYVLTLDGMPDAPDGSRFELWALATDTDPVSLGEIMPQQGALILEGALGDSVDVYTAGFGMAISIEPEDDPEPDSPHHVAIASTMAEGFSGLLQALLADDGANGGGSLTLAVEQTHTAGQHAGFIRDAVGGGNLNGARNHAEHVVNTLDGVDGMFFGDLNRDGQAQNPGDGYGVRAYLLDAKSSMQALLDTDELTDDANGALQEALLSVESAETAMGDAKNQAIKLFAIDTADEAMTVYEELTRTLDELVEAVNVGEESLLAAASLPLLLEADALQAPVVMEPMGSFQLQSELLEDGSVLSGGYVLSIAGMPNAPTGSHYELWLTSADTASLLVDTLVLEDGYLDLVVEIDDAVSPLTDVVGIAVSLEPDDDESPEAPDRVLITSSMAEELAPVLQTLFVDDGTNGGGSLIRALEQTDTAAQHAGFIIDAVAAGNLNGARNHAEHVVNTLDGASGMFFGDLNRDGQAQNPGDGYGVRSYVSDSIASAKTLLEQNISQENLSSLQNTIAALEEAEGLINAAQDQATKLFAIDTDAEAEQVHTDLSAALSELKIALAEGGTEILALASFPLSMDRVVIEELAVAAAEVVETPVEAPTGEPDSDESNEDSDEAIVEELSADETATVTDTATISDTTGISETVELSETATISETATVTEPLNEEEPEIDSEPAVDAETETAQTNGATEDDRSGRSVVMPPPPIAKTGDVWTSAADGRVYVYVTGGEYHIGSEGEGASPREAPAHTLDVDGFWIQQTETTNAHYALCVVNGDCTAPDNERWDDAEFADHPVANVSWEQAQAYAQWAGVQLPSEAQWEIACRGQDASVYPWGDLPPSSQLSNYEDAVNDTSAVGAYPDGAAESGALDMAGNVWEWTRSLDGPYPYEAGDGREELNAEGKRVMRGGSYYYNGLMLRCSARTGANPRTQIPHLGFRTVLPASGETWTNPLDGGVYVYVPADEYAIGSDEKGAMPREAPEHAVSVDDFWIQMTETTNSQYALCVADDACSAPDNERWEDAEFAQHPVSNVSWEQAHTYTVWAGARLPTEVEWEAACRGSDASAYPWGDLPPSPQLSNYGEHVEDTMPVGAYPDGVAYSGALDMAGNVWEWTSSLDADYPYDAADGREVDDAEGKRVMRGGSFYYNELLLRCSTRTGANADTQIPHLGFRTVLGGNSGE